VYSKAKHPKLKIIVLGWVTSQGHITAQMYIDLTSENKDEAMRKLDK
jgi:hypothetical protein